MLLVTVAPSGRMRTGPSKFGRVMTSLSAGGNGYVEVEHRLVAPSTAGDATYSTVRYIPVLGQFRRTRSRRLVDTDFRRADWNSRSISRAAAFSFELSDTSVSTGTAIVIAVIANAMTSISSRSE